MIARKWLDQPNLNQAHRDAGGWQEYCVVYTGYGHHTGDRLRVIMEINDRWLAEENLNYVRARQEQHGGPVDARLEVRTVVASPWSDA